jgi:hypothetical protein
MTTSSVVLNVDPRSQVLKCETSQLKKSGENSIACRSLAVHNFGGRRRGVARNIDDLEFVGLSRHLRAFKPRGI